MHADLTENDPLKDAMPSTYNVTGRITYDLAGKYASFQTGFRTQTERNLVAEVWGDGKRLWESGGFVSKEPAGTTAEVDVRGVRELTLLIGSDASSKHKAQALLIEPRLTPIAAAPVARLLSIAERLDSFDYMWTEPENLGPTINGPGDEFTPSFTADHLRLMYGRRDEKQQQYIVEPVRLGVDQPFGPPQLIPSSSANDIVISFDGLTFACSVRGDIKLRHRTAFDQPWGEAVDPGPQVNSQQLDNRPSLSPDGLILLFSTDGLPASPPSNIRMSRRSSPAAEFGPAQELGPPINTPNYEARAHLLGDGRTYAIYRSGNWMVLDAQRKGGSTEFPLEDAPFVKETDSWFSADGQTVYFSANRPGGLGGRDLYVTRRVPKAGTAAALPPPAAGVVYLDDLPETAFESKGALRKHGDDREGKDLNWLGQKPSHSLFTHPVGVHQPAWVTYALDGRYAEFRTTVGASIAPESPLVFRIFGDDKLLWESKPQAAAQVGVDAVVDVRGVKVLKLEVVARGSVSGAHALWIEPRLTPISLPAEPRTSVSGSAPVPATEVDLLPLVDVAQDVLKGEWSRQGSELHSGLTPTNHALRLPVDPGEAYSLRLAFSADKGYPALTLPFESKGLVIGFTGGEVNLQLKGPKGDRENPQTQVPLHFGDGKRHDVRIDVARPEEGKVRIDIAVDGKAALDWTGTREQLKAIVGPDLPEPVLLFSSFLVKTAPTKLLEAKLATTAGVMKPLRAAPPSAVPIPPGDSPRAKTTAAAPRWPLAPSKPEDIQWLLANRCVVTVRGPSAFGGDSMESTLKAGDAIPSGSQTVVGLEWQNRNEDFATDDDLARIATFIDLERLNFNDAAMAQQITSAGMLKLAALVNLRRLTINQCKDKAAGAEGLLQSMPQLEFLHLPFGRNVSSAWAAAASARPSITEIKAFRCDFVESGLIHFEKMPQLTALILLGNPLLTEAAVERLAAAKPNCRITAEFNGQPRIFEPRTAVSGPAVIPSLTVGALPDNTLSGGNAAAVALLAAIDTARDVRNGSWKKENGLLISGVRGYQTLELPTKPADSYRLEMVAERVSGEGGLSIGLAVGKSDARLFVDGRGGNEQTEFRTGLSDLNGRRFNLADYAGPLYKSEVFPPAAQVALQIDVTPSSITLVVENKQVWQWTGDAGAVQIGRTDIDGYKCLPGTLWLGTYNSKYQISRLNYTLLGAAPPAAKPNN